MRKMYYCVEHIEPVLLNDIWAKFVLDSFLGIQEMHLKSGKTQYFHCELHQYNAYL